MTIKGFGNFDPGAYHHSANSSQNRPHSSEEASGSTSGRNENSGAISSMASSANATFNRIRTMVPNPRVAIRHFVILRQLATRMRNPEQAVRSLDDAQNRFLNRNPDEIAETIEILREAVEHGVIDEETLRWMGDAAMSIFVSDQAVLGVMQTSGGGALSTMINRLLRALGEGRERGPLIALGFTHAQLDRIEAHDNSEFTFAALQDHVPELLRQGRTLEDIATLADQPDAMPIIMDAARNGGQDAAVDPEMDQGRDH